MKYQKTINNIQKGVFTRAELMKLRANAVSKFKLGDTDAKSVIDEIDLASPTDQTIVFMGFCPDADFNNRLDVEWKEKGICTFDFYESEQQLARFNEIWPGDRIVLKKRHIFGKSMKLYGHGRVTSIKYDQNESRCLLMNWSQQDEIIEVPLMGCNSTVDVRTIEQVEAEMPFEFYEWLRRDQ